MPLRLFGSGGGGDRLESIEQKVQTMLRHDRHEFELAMAALLGERRPEEVNDDLRSTDQKVNRLEREIRREVIVHSSVFGGIETPVVLVYMSIVKDIERVGDYAKNLVDLARDGADFSTLADAQAWRDLAAQISMYITEAGEAFRERDVRRGRDLSARGDKLLDEFDDEVSALVRGGEGAPQAVARALAFRYLKRVVAHLMNLLSAVVMPMDRLDYFSEDPEDRGVG
jgi:phosphate uptake regulator